MAPRKSATKTEARERARKAAAEVMSREERLLELGEEFFVAQGEAEQIIEAANQRIAEISAKAEREVVSAKKAQVRVVAGMKAERVPVTEIAQRLELTAAEVRALLKEAPSEEPSGASDDVADDDSGGAHETAEAFQQETVGV